MCNTASTDESEVEDKAAMTEKFQPLLTWMQAEAAHVVRNGQCLDLTPIVLNSLYTTHNSGDIRPTCFQPVRHCCRCKWLHCER